MARSRLCLPAGTPAHKRAQVSQEASELIAIANLLALTLSCLNANLLVILLERCKIFARLREFTFLHAFATYQCTKARLLYMRSNLWSMREKTSAIAVELLIMQHARMTFARTPPGTTVGG